jgi:AcrR family transcriptional regulator
MTSTDRRAREKVQTEQKILDAARQLFASQGYDAVTLRAVADAIEYTPAAIYKHFADKEALIHALCERDFALMAASLPALLAVENPVVRIALLGVEYVRFAVDHPQHFRLMFMNTSEAWWLKDDAERREPSPQEDGYSLLVAATAQAIEEGRLLPPYADVELTAQTYWAVVHGVSTLEVALGKNPFIAWKDIETRTRTSILATMRGTCRPEELPAIEKVLA